MKTSLTRNATITNQMLNMTHVPMQSHPLVNVRMGAGTECNSFKKLEVTKMYRRIFLALIFTLGLLPATLIFSSNASAQQQLDVCYYDSYGNQHDADWCIIGGDLSSPNTMNLSPHCRSEAGATCFLGNSGQCRHTSKKYSQYVIFPKGSGRCPTTFNQAVARSGGGGGGGQIVAPSCPSGFVLSGNQCVRSAAPAPSCPPWLYLLARAVCKWCRSGTSPAGQSRIPTANRAQAHWMPERSS